jgi:hypothetical protein
MPRRPSPAIVVALVALFVSLGGVSYGAALVITGKQIKNGTVTGRDVRNNSLTGSDVKESTLGKVRSAASATSATSAADATELGGAAASAYAKTADILHATVDTSAAGGTLVRGRGALAVGRIALGFYSVTFNRDVSGCTWQATAGRRTDTGVTDFNATPRGTPAGANTVGVVLWNQAGNQVDGPTFFLTVFC